jgi:hypothetical protein
MQVITSTNCLSLPLITCPFVRQNGLSAISKQHTLHHHDKAKPTKLAHVADNASDCTWKVLSPNLGRDAKYQDENGNDDLENGEDDASEEASRVRLKLPEHQLRCAAESS